MNLPIYDGGVASGLLAGFLFGFVLEGAGFGSPRKLVAQFTLRDFSVFKVMFTAVLVAATGLWALEASGAIGTASVYVPTLYLWAFAAGGLLIGAGFAIGGYCPGTSAAALAGGRLDALVFIAGMVIGVILFGAVFDSIEAFYFATPGPEGQTIDELFGLPVPVIIAALGVVAIIGFRIGDHYEARNLGPVEIDDLD
jgi:hypothetical protein